MVAAGPHPPRLCPISARGGGLARGAGRAAARLGVMSRASPAAVSGPPRLDLTPPRPDLTAGGDGAAEASGSRQGREIERRRPARACRRWCDRRGAAHAAGSRDRRVLEEGGGHTGSGGRHGTRRCGR